MDAHLLENSVVQENQLKAYDKFSRTVSAYQDRQSKLQEITSVLNEKIKKLEQAAEKASEKVRRIKTGVRSERGKQARMLR